jgi:hypothetical protein
MVNSFPGRDVLVNDLVRGIAAIIIRVGFALATILGLSEIWSVDRAGNHRLKRVSEPRAG